MQRETSMSKETNKAEHFVADLCRRSFLSLWAYPNPQKKNRGKEHCDLLVVCDPDVVVFSVKEIKVKSSGDDPVDWERWRRKAVEASVKQIHGAMRWLDQGRRVVTGDGATEIPIPDMSVRRVHGVAVALGGERKVLFVSGDLGKGYIHVLDEASFKIVASELDTITDFVTYLRAKEQLTAKVVVESGGEEDLLALYLQNNRSFPGNYDNIDLGENLWTTFRGLPQYRTKKIEDEISYMWWDRLIETVIADYRAGKLVVGQSWEVMEPALRTMAREDRFARRVLSKSFMEFMDLSRQGKVRARRRCSPSGVIYVFLACPLGTVRRDRMSELGLRCFVARGDHPDKPTVVGIATEAPGAHKGFSLDLIHLYQPTWTPEDAKNADKIKADFGFFHNPTLTKAHENEYPQN